MVALGWLAVRNLIAAFALLTLTSCAASPSGPVVTTSTERPTAVTSTSSTPVASGTVSAHPRVTATRRAVPARVPSVTVRATTRKPPVTRRVVPVKPLTPRVAPKVASVYYANCSAARAAGAAPIRRGEPGYRTGLDRNRDGVACEN